MSGIIKYLTGSRLHQGEDTQVKFSVAPLGGDSGFVEWTTAMKMVARLPEGIPAHFRTTLWGTLAEKHLAGRKVNWPEVERQIFSDFCSPDDCELSAQIVKDLHRTGCSLFCGASGQHNQALLKRVLLAYARWNKSVGYCQGLNMMAALILQVMQGSQSATVKVMIYLIEGVLPESYFAENLRGLSVDMAVFRDLLRLKLPELSRHLDALANEARDSSTSAGSFEPPLMDVFTMQWFLTLFSNCLPHNTVLRVWDLIFLEGNQILLRTALAIWHTLADKMLAVRSADEFYSIMTVLAREMLEFGLMDPNNLIKTIDTISISEVNELRDKYRLNVTPHWTVATVARRGLKLFYQDPYDSDDEHFSFGGQESGSRMASPFGNHPDREKIALDISVLKKQYTKLRERQRQAHIIFSAACNNENLGATSSPALNHLLLGKNALLSMKGRRIQGTVPTKPRVKPSGETLHWKDTGERGVRVKQKRRNGVDRPSSEIGGVGKEGRSRSSSASSSSSSSYSSSPKRTSSSSSSSTELCDDSSGSEDHSESTRQSPLPKIPPQVASTNTEDVKVPGVTSHEVREVTSPEVREVTSPEGREVTSPEVREVTPPEGREVTSPEAREVTSPEAREVTLPEVSEVTSPQLIEVTSPHASEECQSAAEDSQPEEPISRLEIIEPELSGAEEKRREFADEGRRGSELALMQILQENSEILQRIQQQQQQQQGVRQRSEDAQEDSQQRPQKPRQASLDQQQQQPSIVLEEPEDIKEIRRRYTKTSSLEVPPSRPALETSRSLEAQRTSSPEAQAEERTSSSLDNSRQCSSENVSSSSAPSSAYNPFPTRSPRRNTELGLKLGLYSRPP